MWGVDKILTPTKMSFQPLCKSPMRGVVQFIVGGWKRGLSFTFVARFKKFLCGITSDLNCLLNGSALGDKALYDI
jgi:hypothetical protein